MTYSNSSSSTRSTKLLSHFKPRYKSKKTPCNSNWGEYASQIHWGAHSRPDGHSTHPAPRHISDVLGFVHLLIAAGVASGAGGQWPGSGPLSREHGASVWEARTPSQRPVFGRLPARSLSLRLGYQSPAALQTGCGKLATRPESTEKGQQTPGRRQERGEQHQSQRWPLSLHCVWNQDQSTMQTWFASSLYGCASVVSCKRF